MPASSHMAAMARWHHHHYGPLISYSNADLHPSPPELSYSQPPDLLRHSSEPHQPPAPVGLSATTSLPSCTAYAARRGVVSRMGAQATTIHLRPPGPFRHLACRRRPYSYRTTAGATTTDPAILVPLPRTPRARTRTCVCSSDGRNGLPLRNGCPYFVEHQTRTTT